LIAESVAVLALQPCRLPDAIIRFVLTAAHAHIEKEKENAKATMAWSVLGSDAAVDVAAPPTPVGFVNSREFETACRLALEAGGAPVPDPDPDGALAAVFEAARGGGSGGGGGGGGYINAVAVTAALRQSGLRDSILRSIWREAKIPNTPPHDKMCMAEWMKACRLATEAGGLRLTVQTAANWKVMGVAESVVGTDDDESDSFDGSEFGGDSDSDTDTGTGTRSHRGSGISGGGRSSRTLQGRAGAGGTGDFDSSDDSAEGSDDDKVRTAGPLLSRAAGSNADDSGSSASESDSPPAGVLTQSSNSSSKLRSIATERNHQRWGNHLLVLGGSASGGVGGGEYSTTRLLPTSAPAPLIDGSGGRGGSSGAPVRTHNSGRNGNGEDDLGGRSSAPNVIRKF
jgi:hypothetical protein